MAVAHWLVLAVSLCSTPCALKPVDNLQKADREIRIGDVVELDCIAEDKRDAIGTLTIAVLPPGQSRVEFERAAIKALVRRRAPGLSLAAEPDDAGILVVSTSPPPTAPVAQTCKQARNRIAAGRIIVSDDVEIVPCEPDAHPAPLAYDRSHNVVRATTDIAPGDHLGRLVMPRGVYDTGEPISVAISIGNVRIERATTAVQPALAGQDIFVRDSDGVVFSVPTPAHPDGEK
jgi:hypothetical protein